MPPLDPERVTRKVDQLNKQTPNIPHWTAVDGYHSIVTLNIDGEKPSLNLNSGIPVKTFVNTTSGEVRTFDIRAVATDPSLSHD